MDNYCKSVNYEYINFCMNLVYKYRFEDLMVIIDQKTLFEFYILSHYLNNEIKLSIGLSCNNLLIKQHIFKDLLNNGYKEVKINDLFTSLIKHDNLWGSMVTLYFSGNVQSDLVIKYFSQEEKSLNMSIRGFCLLRDWLEPKHGDCELGLLV